MCEKALPSFKREEKKKKPDICILEVSLSSGFFPAWTQLSFLSGESSQKLAFFLTASYEKRTHFQGEAETSLGTGLGNLFFTEFSQRIYWGHHRAQSWAVGEPRRLLATEGTVMLLLISTHPC